MGAPIDLSKPTLVERLLDAQETAELMTERFAGSPVGTKFELVHAELHAAIALANEGFAVLSEDKDAFVDVADVERALRDQGRL